MKIKSVENFSLAECQEYLDTNPNGEFAQEVVQRMEYLQQIIARRSQQNNDRWINEFNTEFNRHFATQRYEEAFAICLKYLSKVDRKAEIVEKANSVIPKLKNRIQLPSSVAISYDWLIDQLVLNGYDKMKYNGDSLKLNKSRVKIQTKGNLLEIVSRINPILNVLPIIMSIITGVIIPLFAYPIGYYIYNDLYEYTWKYEVSDHFEEMLGIGIIFALCFFILWLALFIDIHKQPKVLLHKIAHIIVENLAK